MDNTISSPAVEVERDWYFTFGFDHRHPITGQSLAKNYVVLHGTRDSTREQMFAAFGRDWSMQYDRADGGRGTVGVERFGLTRIELPGAAEPASPRTWHGLPIPADVQQVTDAEGHAAHRHGELWCYDNMPGRHSRAAQVTEPELLRFHGPVTEAPAEPPAPRSWSAGDVIPADVDEVTDSDQDPRAPIGTWRRSVEGIRSWRFHTMNGTRGDVWGEAEMLAVYGPVFAALPVDEQPADEPQPEPSEIGRPDIVPGDEYADWDEDEKRAVRDAYVAEHGPEVDAERRGEL